MSYHRYSLGQEDVNMFPPVVPGAAPAPAPAGPPMDFNKNLQPATWWDLHKTKIMIGAVVGVIVIPKLLKKFMIR